MIREFRLAIASWIALNHAADVASFSDLIVSVCIVSGDVSSNTRFRDVFGRELLSESFNSRHEPFVR